MSIQRASAEIEKTIRKVFVWWKVFRCMPLQNPWRWQWRFWFLNASWLESWENYREFSIGIAQWLKRLWLTPWVLLARMPAPLTHSLPLHCSLRSRGPLRSFVRPLAHSLAPELIGKWFISMNRMHQFNDISNHSALLPLHKQWLPFSFPFSQENWFISPL